RAANASSSSRNGSPLWKLPPSQTTITGPANGSQRPRRPREGAGKANKRARRDGSTFGVHAGRPLSHLRGLNQLRGLNMRIAERTHFALRGLDSQTADRSDCLLGSLLRRRLDHGHGDRRASGRDRSAGGLEVVEAVEVLVESTLEVGLVPLDPVEV